MITKEEWNEWIEMAPTKAVRELAKKRREEIKDLWENGVFAGKPVEDAMAVGGCKALQLLADMDYEEVIESELVNVVRRPEDDAI